MVKEGPLDILLLRQFQGSSLCLLLGCSLKSDYEALKDDIYLLLSGSGRPSTKALLFCVSMDDVRLIPEQSGNLKKQMRGQRRKMDGLRLWSLVLNGPFLSLYSQCWWAGWHEDDQSRACMRCPCPSFAHPPQSAACKLAANSLSALRLLFQNIFPPVHDILPPPPFLFSRDPQLCPFLLFSCELPLTFPAECREPASCREHCPPQF